MKYGNFVKYGNLVLNQNLVKKISKWQNFDF